MKQNFKENENYIIIIFAWSLFTHIFSLKNVLRHIRTAKWSSLLGNALGVTFWENVYLSSATFLNNEKIKSANDVSPPFQCSLQK